MQDDPSRIQDRGKQVQADMLANEVQSMLRMAAEPANAGELFIEQIRRAARRCGLSFSRARKLWYAEAKVSAVDFVESQGAGAPAEVILLPNMEE